MMEYAIEWIKYMNPTLLLSPPPVEETSGKDICFLGPSGDIQQSDVILCSDLIDGHRGVVASWYVSKLNTIFNNSS